MSAHPLGRSALMISMADLRAAWRASLAQVGGAWLLVCGAVGWVGASLCWQAAWQARRVLGDQSFIGPEYLRIMVTEFGPLMLGTMLAAQGGGGLASSLATRRDSQQVDAVVVLGGNPWRLFALPQILGWLLSALILAPAVLLSGELAGILTMQLAYSVEPASFFSPDALRPADITFSVIKMVIFGLLIGIMGARAGLRAQPGAAGVGQAAVEGVVHGSMAVLAADALMDAARFWLDQGG